MTLKETATFSEGSSLEFGPMVSSSAVTVSAVTPNRGTMGTTVAVTIDGSGFVSGATVSAGTGITVSNVVFVSSTRLTASLAIAGGATSGLRDVTVTNPDNGGGTLTNGFTVNPPVTLTLVYNGKLRDTVGGGDTALAPDGAADATITLTLNAAGGRTVTAVQLVNGVGGGWDTIAPDASRVLGGAVSLNRAPLNEPTTMAVTPPGADGGSPKLFASDYLGGVGFAPGRNLTGTAP